jgi:hypothetical protein
MMTFFTLNFFLLYILFPLIGLIIGVVLFFVGKKTNLLKGKKEIIFFLLSCFLLPVPALLGFINYHFMPYGYWALLLLYLGLGVLFMPLLKKYVTDWEDKPYYVEILCISAVMVVAAMFFSLIFNLSNELQYGWWACTSLLPFMFPSLFWKAYKEYLAIPAEVYDVWKYEEEEEISLENIDRNKIIVVELELFKQVKDTKPFTIQVKSSENMQFGSWFKMCIDDYNKKSPSSPIAATGADTAGWMFYVISAILGRQKHIDPALTFGKNKIKQRNFIIAKRVSHQENEIT